ncbi:hypothetical protein DW1_0691 [Proteiniborus sp. DW1]|uniref:hypothetical protein n=1 Tax=Proteiniborus sp. DW1 TaxID=1889883 RepID=UPI00092E04B9|nr:hypothetical protein [Proteiniborus sp. DW1]SCG82300.1 hypothetical protein DW1_0691 [Proteiniborus sp. DW1]
MYYGLSDHQSFVDNNICGVTIGQENLNDIHTSKDTNDDMRSVYKYSNTEEDIINLIEELDLEESIEKIINDLGI